MSSLIHGRDVVGNTELEKYMRVVSMAIAGYDYVLTLPTEYRIYRSQPHIFRMSLACILFILIRYTSVMVMIVSNYGAFATSFTSITCSRYFYVSPIFKVVQSMVSHAILGIRTFNITRRNRRVGIFLSGFYTTTVILECFFNLYNRVPQVTDGSCISGSSSGTPISWLFYLFAMIYDLATLVISTVYLWQYKTHSGHFTRLVRVMMYDGLIYFVALTAVNVLNTILYRAPSVVAQSTASSLAYAVIWIMSQRILIHLRELSDDVQGGHINNVIVSPHGVSVPRSPFRSQKGQLDQPGLRMTVANDVELGVRIHVEQCVTVDYSKDEEFDHLPRKSDM